MVGAESARDRPRYFVFALSMEHQPCKESIGEKGGGKEIGACHDTAADVSTI